MAPDSSPSSAEHMYGELREGSGHQWVVGFMKVDGTSSGGCVFGQDGCSSLTGHT